MFSEQILFFDLLIFPLHFFPHILFCLISPYEPSSGQREFDVSP